MTGNESGKDGATLTTAVDFNWGDKVATPAKLTWKFPKPLGIAGIAFDKLEMDKSGNQKLEAVVDMDKMAGIAALKVDFKSNLKTPLLVGTSLGATYTGISNALCKVEVDLEKVLQMDFKAEKAYNAQVSYSMGDAAVAVKHTPEDPLAVGVQYVNGPAFFSCMVQETFAARSLHGAYKVNNDLKVVGNYNQGGKADGTWSGGLAWNGADGTHIKKKITGKGGANLCLSAVIKQTLAKGVTVTAGANFPLDGKDSAMSWGLAFNVE